MRNWIMTTRQHAVIDYIWAAAVPLIPRMFNWSRTSTRILDSVAVVGAAQSMVTDYQGGVKGVIPMQAHLAGDAVIGVGLIACATLLTDAEPEERLGLGLLGAFAVAASVLTEPIPRGRGRDRAKQAAKRIRSFAGDQVAAFAGANPSKKRKPSSEPSANQQATMAGGA